jgi:hypothetical protein
MRGAKGEKGKEKKNVTVTNSGFEKILVAQASRRRWYRGPAPFKGNRNLMLKRGWI